MLTANLGYNELVGLWPAFVGDYVAWGDVLNLDGEMLDAPHLKQAQRILAQIDERDSTSAEGTDPCMAKR